MVGNWLEIGRGIIGKWVGQMFGQKGSGALQG
jgi:hypothetical protein